MSTSRDAMRHTVEYVLLAVSLEIVLGIAVAVTLHRWVLDAMARTSGTGLPPDIRQAALIPTAHPIGNGFRPARRRPVDEVLHINGYQEATP